MKPSLAAPQMGRFEHIPRRFPGNSHRQFAPLQSTLERVYAHSPARKARRDAALTAIA